MRGIDSPDEEKPDSRHRRPARRPVDPARGQLFEAPGVHRREDLDVVVAVDIQRLRNGAARVSARKRRAMLWIFRDRKD